MKNKSPAPKLLQRFEIRRRYQAGETMQEIADSLGLAKCRVGQITQSLQINGYDTAIKRTWGLTHEQYASIRKEFGYAPFRAFCSHRARAGRHGIPFKMTFGEWWGVWLMSDKWHVKGRGRGRYVMCRLLDKGAYQLGNVSIKTNEDNAMELHRISRPFRRMRKIIERYKSATRV